MGAMPTQVQVIRIIDQSQQYLLEIFNIVSHLVQVRLQLFQNQFYTENRDDQIPVNYLIGNSKGICTSISLNSMEVYTELGDITQKFSKNYIAKTASSVLYRSLQGAFEDFSQGYNQIKKQVLLTNQMGALIKVDFLVVVYLFQDSGLGKYFRDIFGYEAMISTVDKRRIKEQGKIGRDQYVNMVKRTVTNQFGRVRKDILEGITKLIEDAPLNERQIEQLEYFFNKRNNTRSNTRSNSRRATKMKKRKKTRRK